MRLRRFITQFLALSLAILTLAATSPVSAAELAAPANIGSVSAVGSVQLRGVGISEGTLFSGDRLNVGQGGYAKVVLGAGPKVEVGGSSDVVVSKDNDAINIQMTSGNIAFSGNGQKPVRVRVGTYEVTASGQTKGSVTFVGSSVVSIRVLEGSANVRNTATRQSSTVSKGNTKLVSMDHSNQSGALLASTVPSAIPPAPSMPAPRALSSGTKTALIVGSVLGTAAAIAILMTKNDDTDAEAAARLRKTTGSQTLGNVATTQAAAATAANDVSNAATATNTAVNATATSATFTQAEKTSFLNRSSTLTSQANASKASIANLQTQLAALQAQLANANSSNIAAIETQINTILNSTNAEVANLNGLIAQLNTLLNEVRAELPTLALPPAVQPVAPAVPASPTNP